MSSPKKPLLACRVAIAVPLRQCFDYLLPDSINHRQLLTGMRVEVPFGRQTKIGIITETCVKSTVDPSRLKAIKSVVDESPILQPQDLQLLVWAANYYHHPIGEVIHSALPTRLRQNHSTEPELEPYLRLTRNGIDCVNQLAKNAVKQRRIIAALSNAKQQQLSNKRLSRLVPGWQTSVNSLISKGLVEQFQSSETDDPLKTTSTAAKLTLNAAQQQAIDAVSQSLHTFGVFLLDGVTGSGKTEVYMQLIQQVLDQDKQVLVLLPEIALTPQLEHRFQQRFSVPIAIYHSALGDAARCQHWIKFSQGRAALLLGTRSATFIPMSKPGLIIIDEEHDPSFKQQEGFRFSARNVAMRRAQLLNIPILLGTATPALETLHNARTERYQLLQLPMRAGNATMPALQRLDIRGQKIDSGLSNALLSQIDNTLTAKEQVMLFINRRGYAPAYMCHQCGWVARCPRCDSNTVVHKNKQRLWCHHCGSNVNLASHCPACQSKELIALGVGTERVERFLSDHYPEARIARFDRDVITSKTALDTLLKSVNDLEVDIVIGTQMLAKGHHFPNVTLVSILDTDQGLFSTDFRAAERLAQMIIQVAGRSGRAEKPGKVLLQTRQPEHPLLSALIEQNYQAFAINALQERQHAQLPPFSHQALFRSSASKPEQALKLLDTIRQQLELQNKDTVLILGPVPAPMEKRAGQYRYQLLLQSQNRQLLHRTLHAIIAFIDTLKESKAARWSVDVDPIDLY